MRGRRPLPVSAEHTCRAARLLRGRRASRRRERRGPTVLPVPRSRQLPAPPAPPRALLRGSHALAPQDPAPSRGERTAAAHRCRHEAPGWCTPPARTS
eukprot:5817010-Prymnesium_polylepis.1